MVSVTTQKEIPVGETPSEEVIIAVADHLGVDPIELKTPLAAVIDPDALDRIALYTPSELKFRYNGCEVVVKDGSVVEVTTITHFLG